MVDVDDQRPEIRSKLFTDLKGWAANAGFANPIMREEELEQPNAGILMSAVSVQAFWENEFLEDVGFILQQWSSK